MTQGQRVEFNLRLVNLHDRPVVVDHVHASCSCLQATTLPCLLNEGESKAFSFVLDLAEEPEFVGNLSIDYSGHTPENLRLFGANVVLVVRKG